MTAPLVHGAGHSPNERSLERINRTARRRLRPWTCRAALAPVRAYEANGWPNEVAEYDPHGVAAGGMYSECPIARQRWYA